MLLNIVKIAYLCYVYFTVIEKYTNWKKRESGFISGYHLGPLSLFFISVTGPTLPNKFGWLVKSIQQNTLLSVIDIWKLSNYRLVVLNL